MRIKPVYQWLYVIKAFVQQPINNKNNVPLFKGTLFLRKGSSSVIVATLVSSCKYSVWILLIDHGSSSTESMT